MARIWSAGVVLMAALALASGTRMPLQAATTPAADVVFIMEAAQATFTNATTLALNGLTGSAQSYGAGSKTGIYPIQNFTNGAADGQYVDSNGQWLSNPQAVMYAVAQNSEITTVLLTLSNPTIPQQPAGTTTTNNNNNNNNNNCGTTNNNNNGPPQLTFTVALVPADASKVKVSNGVVAEKITEVSTGAGNLAQAITPGATFGPVVFYIDQNQQGLPKKATTKWGSGGWGNSGNSYKSGYYNNGWGSNRYGSSSNNNNNNNNGGYGSNNNNNNNNNGGGYGGSNNNNNNNNNNGGHGSNNNNNNNNGGGGSRNNNNNNNNGK